METAADGYEEIVEKQYLKEWLGYHCVDAGEIYELAGSPVIVGLRGWQSGPQRQDWRGSIHRGTPLFSQRSKRWR